MHLSQRIAISSLLKPRSLYATLPVAVALVTVVDPRLIGTWHVPEREPVVMQIYPRQQGRESTLHEPTEDNVRNHPEHSGRHNDAKQIRRTGNPPPSVVQAWKGLTSLLLISKGAPATTVVRQRSYPFASGTTTGAVLGRAGGKASEIATGIGSGTAVAGENIIMKIAMMTFKGILIAPVEGYKFCGKRRTWFVDGL